MPRAGIPDAAGAAAPRAWIAAAAMLLLPAAAAAQQCPDGGRGAEIGVTAGAIHYDVGDGSDGIELGVEGAWRPGPLQLRMGVSRALLESGTADPTLLRASAGRSLLTRGRLSLCGAALAGLSWLAGSGDRALTLAGGAQAGIGARLPLARGGITPYVAVRVLAAHTTGEVLGLDVSASGASVGGEAGAALELGRAVVRGSASLDALDPGLGATPYPARAFRVGLGWRF